MLKSGTGIFNLFSIVYSNWPRLRISTNPEWINRSHGTLRLSANRNFTCFFVTYTNMLTSLIRHLSLRSSLFLSRNAPLPLYQNRSFNINHSFGDLLEPRLFLSAITLDQ